MLDIAVRAIAPQESAGHQLLEMSSRRECEETALDPRVSPIGSSHDQAVLHTSLAQVSLFTTMIDLPISKSTCQDAASLDTISADTRAASVQVMT